jgi:hypothetical protein
MIFEHQTGYIISIRQMATRIPKSLVKGNSHFLKLFNQLVSDYAAGHIDTTAVHTDPSINNNSVSFRLIDDHKLKVCFYGKGIGEAFSVLDVISKYGVTKTLFTLQTYWKNII